MHTYPWGRGAWRGSPSACAPWSPRSSAHRAQSMCHLRRRRIMCRMRRRRIQVSAHRAQSMCHMRRRRIHVSYDEEEDTFICTQGTKHSHQRTLLSKDWGGGYMCETTLIKGLSSHQRTLFKRLSSKASHHHTSIVVVGIMHKDTSVCVSHTFMCALNRMCSYVAPEKDLRL